MKGLGLEHKHYNDGQHIVRLVANWLVGIITITVLINYFTLLLTEKYVLILQFIWKAYQTQKSVLIIHKIY